MKYLPPSPDNSAFSLVEVSIAMAIAAVALLSIIGMIPTATKGAANSADQTAIGTMFEDIEDRIKTKVLRAGPIEGSPFYYDLRGSHIDPVDDGEETTVLNERFFRVEVELIEPASTSADGPNFESALAVQVKIFWPIDEDGEAVDPDKPGSEITFLAGAQTGPEWTEVDGNYEPKIEY
ncbi:MAG: prepilin-type N-terminal cleavage/methylation domain-containing protein [Verrucomicrobiales bacterium]|nr:prepilin-type N-terminal cleavage/methylation domain-containing protein [Verrucomicrobiales bacterium]